MEHGIIQDILSVPSIGTHGIALLALAFSLIGNMTLKDRVKELERKYDEIVNKILQENSSQDGKE